MSYELCRSSCQESRLTAGKCVTTDCGAQGQEDKMAGGERIKNDAPTLLM